MEEEYATLHENLINSLFEEAKFRNSNKLNPESKRPVMKRQSTFRKKILRRRSDVSVTKQKTPSRPGIQRKQSMILEPSRHKFADSIKNIGRGGMKKLCALHEKMKQRRKRNGIVMKIKSKKFSHRTDLTASCDDSPTRSTSVYQYLDDLCFLQKDSGRGTPIGSSISARGRDDTMVKINEKMDTLAEMEQQGHHPSASLIRVPAKVIHLSSKKNSEGFVETRSMIGIKLGLISMKYGILVHWHQESGKAKLILLRKMCGDSFMKGEVHQQKNKSKVRKSKI
jgi:hypothetical protein